MGSLGWQELLIVLVIVIIIFGAGKITDIGGAMGKSIKEFKAETGEGADVATTDGANARPLSGQTSPLRESSEEVLIGAADRREGDAVYVGERPANRGVRADEI